MPTPYFNRIFLFTKLFNVFTFSFSKFIITRFTFVVVPVDFNTQQNELVLFNK